MKSYSEIIAALDGAQQKAALSARNTVVAAGAGSGKTRVLAARYIHLVVEKGLPVDSILALTFTQKAATEMEARIYATLRETDHPAARKALDEFHRARISTIDSFCSTIARSACRSFGVPPDFSIDNDQAARMAGDLALPFLLANRTNAAVMQLLRRFPLEVIAEQLFVDPMVRHSPLSDPDDYGAMLKVQDSEVEHRLKALLPEALSSAQRLYELCREPSLAKNTGPAKMRDILKTPPELPEADANSHLLAFLTQYRPLAALAIPGNVSNPDMIELKEVQKKFKEEQFPILLRLANYVFNRPVIEETFALMENFRKSYLERKRQSGILTFLDVARLAVDALLRDGELRALWKRTIKAIMIDEFQDNNALQRDLLFLIAEKEERTALNVPEPDELCPDKLFFVGDEKQSIYRFRGADVSVFRSLAADLRPESGSGTETTLETNYRTESGLIETFNALFPSVFLAAADLPAYEAGFSGITAFRKTAGLESAMEVLIIDEEQGDNDDADQLDAGRSEAAAVASEIQKLLESKTAVRGPEGSRPCTPDDIAILFRSTGRQMVFEDALRAEGIPYQAENMKGLFSDAPLNDLYAVLRTAVFPSDMTAWAIMLRSPFVSLSGDGFTAVLLEAAAMETPQAFAPDSGLTLSEEDRRRYNEGQALYERVRALADRIPSAELVSRLWYQEGYRSIVLAKPPLHRFAGLYDYFFELARRSDERGETLAAFLDSMRELIFNKAKLDSLDIPVEGAGGVRLMTIHKSKGLEFPIVFVVNCNNVGNNDKSNTVLYHTPAWGIAVNTGSIDEDIKAEENYFYHEGKKEEQLKSLAELRRLLYVAMTRAETRLYVTGTLKLPVPEETESGSGLEALAAKAASIKSTRSFFDLLLPAIINERPPSLLLTILPPGTAACAGKQENKARGASECLAAYNAASERAAFPSERRVFAATALKKLSSASEAPQEQFTRGPSPGESTSPDRTYAAFGLQSAEFGTLAHQYIEARLNGKTPILPADLSKTLDSLAERFFGSELGRLALSADWKESEFGFITRWTLADAPILVTGQADLVFGVKDTVYIVDYKTDSFENPEDHRLQMSVYRKAAADLWRKKVETWLFYLKSGTAVELR